MTNESETERSIVCHLNSEDPLSFDAISSLINHREEDLYVDYKEGFDPTEEKQWHGITTDSMAFANTLGGYIVFGIRDGDFSVVGLSDVASEALANTNMVLQKLNRYVLPAFSTIRTKLHRMLEGVSLIIMHIPESRGRTHMFVKDVSYKYPSEKSVLLASAGMIYARRSATNQVMGPEDLEFIINRRIEYYKDSIMGKIAKVVHAPTEHQILVFDPQGKGAAGNNYFISDSPDAVPVKGMSFTVAPKTDVEEICGWISLSGPDPAFRPSDKRLWHMYSVRENLVLTDEQRAHMVEFSLFAQAPVFYWLNTLTALQIKIALQHAFKRTTNMRLRPEILKVAAFVGRTFYTTLLKSMGENRNELQQNLSQCPNDPIREYCGPMGARDNNRPRWENKLEAIATELSQGNGGVLEKQWARAFDCRLYAKTDKYVGKGGTRD